MRTMNALHIFTKFTIRYLKVVILKSGERMPISVLFSSIVFGIFVTQIAIDGLPSYIENILGKSIITLIVMFLLSVAVYLYSEARNISKRTGGYAQLGTLFVGVLFYYFFEEGLFNNFYAESFIYIVMTIVCTIAAIFIAPFLYGLVKRQQLAQRELYIFGYSVVQATIMATIVGTVIMLLGFAGWAAITTLFEISIDDIYAYWAAFSLSLLAPVFFLSQIPSVRVDAHTPIEDSKFFGFLIKYIGIPAIAFYFVILYLYTLKVLINFSDWPHGEVAWMVIGFSFFGYLIYTAAYIFENDFKPAKIFRAWFPYVVVPQVAMLFYAIGLRINQYDVTINRYFVVAFGFWLLLISLHFIFSRHKYLGAIPLSLMVFIATISIGPWGVYSYPEARQLTNLQANLTEAGILQEGVIIPITDAKSIDAKLSGEIYEGIEYICNNHGCDALQPLLGDELATVRAKDIEEFEKIKQNTIQRKEKMIAEESDAEIVEMYTEDISDTQESAYTPMRNWAIIAVLTELIGVERYNAWGRDSDGVERYITFTQEEQSRGEGAILVRGFDYYVRLGQVYPNFGFVYEADMSEQNTLYQVVFDISSESVVLKKYGEVVATFDIAEQLTAIKSGNRSAMSFVLDDSSLRLKIVLYDITLPNPQWVQTADELKEERFVENTNVYGYALIKEK